MMSRGKGERESKCRNKGWRGMLNFMILRLEILINEQFRLLFKFYNLNLREDFTQDQVLQNWDMDQKFTI